MASHGCFFGSPFPGETPFSWARRKMQMIVCMCTCVGFLGFGGLSYYSEPTPLYGSLNCVVGAVALVAFVLCRSAPKVKFFYYAPIVCIAEFIAILVALWTPANVGLIPVILFISLLIWVAVEQHRLGTLLIMLCFATMSLLLLAQAQWGFNLADRKQNPVSIVAGTNGMIMTITSVAFVPLLILVFIKANIGRSADEERRMTDAIKAAKQVSLCIARYDTERAATILEEMSETLDPRTAAAFHTIVQNLNLYRSYIPSAVVRHCATFAVSGSTPHLVSVERVAVGRGSSSGQGSASGGQGSSGAPVVATSLARFPIAPSGETESPNTNPISREKGGRASSASSRGSTPSTSSGFRPMDRVSRLNSVMRQSQVMNSSGGPEGFGGDASDDICGLVEEAELVRKDSLSLANGYHTPQLILPTSAKERERESQAGQPALLRAGGAYASGHQTPISFPSYDALDPPTPRADAFYNSTDTVQLSSGSFHHQIIATPLMSGKFTNCQALLGILSFDDVLKAGPDVRPAELVSRVASGVEILTRLLKQFGGRIHAMMGPVVLIGWGVETPLPRSCTDVVARFSLELRKAFLKPPAPVQAGALDSSPERSCFVEAGSPSRISCAFAMGPCCYGVAGDEVSKQFCLFGPNNLLHREPGKSLGTLFQAARFHNAIVMSSELAEFAHGSFHCRVIDVVQSRKGNGVAGVQSPSKGKGLTKSLLSGASQATPPQGPTQAPTVATASPSVTPTGKPSNASTPAQPVVMTLPPSDHLSPAEVSGTSLPAANQSTLSNSNNSSSGAEAAMKVVEVVAPVKSDLATDSQNNQEWMYALQHSSQSSSFGICEVMNRAVDRYMSGHYDEAAHVLDSLTAQQRQDPRLRRLEGLVAQHRRLNGLDSPFVRVTGWKM